MNVIFLVARRLGDGFAVWRDGYFALDDGAGTRRIVDGGCFELEAQ